MTVPAPQTDRMNSSPDTRPPIAITMGDPAGCGPQITARAWASLRGDPNCAAYVIGNPSLYEPYCPVQIVERAADVVDVWPRALPDCAAI